MKSLLILPIMLLLGVTMIFGQEKSVQSGNILFHTIAKRDVKANAEKFESCKLERSAGGEAAAAEDEAATIMATMVAAMLKDRKGS